MNQAYVSCYVHVHGCSHQLMKLEADAARAPHDTVTTSNLRIRLSGHGSRTRNRTHTGVAWHRYE